MRVTHIFHSGFLVELERHVLVFDWWDGSLPAFGPNKDVVVFVSHKHADHFDTRIWDLEGDNTSYVLDFGCRTSARGHQNVTFVKPYERRNLGDLVVETLASNDEGVAFVISVEGHTIYHAGDLNVWWWDRPQEENEGSLAFCRGELTRIVSKPVDVAMVPLDVRLADPDGPVRCIELFMQEVGADHVFPMHYWYDKETAMSWANSPRLAQWRDKLHFEDSLEI